MKTFYYLKFIFLFGSLLFISCSKEKEEVAPTVVFSPCKLMSVQERNQTRTLEYDSKNRIIRFGDESFEYNNQNQLIRRRRKYKQAQPDGTFKDATELATFTWKGKALMETLIIFPEDKPTGRTTYKYTIDSQNRIVKSNATFENFITSQTGKSSTSFEYDASGNMIKVNNSADFPSFTVLEYTYDNKPGLLGQFYRMMYPDDFTWYNVNNISSFKSGGTLPSVLQYSYTYNAQGYPVQFIQRSNASEVITSYTYECR